jgi:hypothetical protein
MADENIFLEPIRRFRAHEEALDAVRRYKRAFLREMRLHVRDPHLGRALEGGDTG